VTLADFCDPV